MSSQNVPPRSGPTLGEVLAKVRVSTATGVLGFALAAIGSVGPWAVFGGLLSVDGTVGDGRITLGLAVFGVLVLVIGRGASVASAIAALVTLALAAIAVGNLVDLNHVATKPTVGVVVSVSAGWGLPVVLAGAVLALAAIASEVTRFRLPAPGPAQPQRVDPDDPSLPPTVWDRIVVGVLAATLIGTVLAVHVFGA